jgi:hypothetical protein
VITEQARAWVVHLACSKPKELGYAAELWTRRLLAQHVRREALRAGYPSLSRAAKATVQRILAEQPLHPERVRYYLEKRDPAFEARMRDVLLVYQEVALLNATQRSGEGSAVITVSVDEKPGLQAIANTAPDLPPVPGEHPHVGRDHEYKRLGTCSILAALDLHAGHVTARVERRHRSREFIALLQDLDQYYPVGCTIRIILDNHSAHISKETQAYLATRANRFQYVLTPKHGSWPGSAEPSRARERAVGRTFVLTCSVVGEVARETFDHVQPRGSGGREAQVETWMPFEPALRLGVSFPCRLRSFKASSDAPLCDIAQAFPGRTVKQGFCAVAIQVP